jgi:hypothetical protein
MEHVQVSSERTPIRDKSVNSRRKGLNPTLEPSPSPVQQRPGTNDSHYTIPNYEYDTGNPIQKSLNSLSLACLSTSKRARSRATRFKIMDTSSEISILLLGAIIAIISLEGSGMGINARSATLGVLGVLICLIQGSRSIFTLQKRAIVFEQAANKAFTLSIKIQYLNCSGLTENHIMSRIGYYYAKLSEIDMCMYDINTTIVTSRAKSSEFMGDETQDTMPSQSWSALRLPLSQVPLNESYHLPHRSSSVSSIRSMVQAPLSSREVTMDEMDVRISLNTDVSSSDSWEPETG